MRLALVTGGQRRVGGAISARLARDGWTLAIHGHTDATPDAETAVHLHDWHGFVADLADPAQVDALIPAVTAHFGRAPDLLVNSASVFDADEAASSTAAARASHHAVNAEAPIALALSLARLGSGASVVNILDQRVRNPNRDQFSYTLSKQALAAATRTLAVALAPGIRVNAVAPGMTLATSDHDAAKLARIAQAMPLRRLPDPADVADAVAWLANARSVTGQTVFVDGGASLKSFDRDFVYF